MTFRSIFKSIFSSPLPAAAGAAAVILFFFFAWFVFFRSSETEQVTALLNRAYKLQRPFESRISGLDYAPVGDTRGEDKSQVNRRELDKAHSISRDSAIRQETAESFRNEGRVFLVKGDFDRAIESLEKAKKLAPKNAEIMNDLGAAQLEKAKSLSGEAKKANLELKTEALANFDKAIELDPNLLAAYFDRALSLQVMSLPGQAGEAWQEYLSRDPSSGWALEARKNLELIGSGATQSKKADDILQDFMAAYREKDDESAYRIVSRNREMITGKLVPQRLAFLFLTSVGADKREFLSALEYIGRLEKERSTDPYVSDIAKYYSSATAENQASSRQAHESVNQGYNLSLRKDFQAALVAFINARDIFKRAGNISEARFCDYWIGYCLYRLDKIEESTQTLADLADFAQSRDYKWLTAQAFSWLAINTDVSKEYSKAIEYNKKTLDLSAAVSDLYLTEKASAQLADVYRGIGDYSQAIGFIFKSLEIAAMPEASLRQRWRDYDAAADMFFAMKNYSAAKAYKKESIELAAKLNEDTFSFTAHTGLGLIYGTQGKYEEAFDSFDKSRQIAAGFGDEELKNYSNAYNALQTAHIQRQAGNCNEALKTYGEAISYFDAIKLKAYSYDAHKGLLMCHYKNGDETAFRTELPIILDLFREYRKTIREEQNRNIFFDKEQSIYDVAVDHEFDSANYDKAFYYSEESRTRSLLDLLSSPIEVSQKESLPEIPLPANTIQPLDLNEIQARMPVNVQIVQYSVLTGKTLIWLIEKDGFQVVKTDISSQVLEEKVSAYRDLLSKNDASNAGIKNELAKELYNILITPVEKKLDAGKKICFIPDKILFRLPFSTLISPATGKYLLSEYVVFSSPSANIFLICSEKALERKQDAAETLLSVGDPSFNKSDFGGLKPLAFAGKEARDISLFYENKVLLTKEDATKEKIKENLPQANVIHFAGHYVVNKSWPLLSGLVLAENRHTRDVKDSLLANHEIVGEKLSNSRLIVLSACQTGVERFYNGEGMIGAARSFLATGVPLVVASQWDVDSDATAELMTHFHRYRKHEGLSTVEALRRAQLDMLEGENERYRNPYYWAAFETIGGYAEF